VTNRADSIAAETRVAKLVSVVIAHDEAGLLFFNGPLRREAFGVEGIG
jgi:hypothetical protein